jgi:hypothetical protein
MPFFFMSARCSTLSFFVIIQMVLAVLFAAAIVLRPAFDDEASRIIQIPLRKVAFFAHSFSDFSL